VHNLSNNDETPSPFPLGAEFWCQVAETLNKRGNYVWALLRCEDGFIIGVQKIMAREGAMSFKQQYGGFNTAYRVTHIFTH